MRNSFITVLILVGLIVSIGNIYPLLFSRELPAAKISAYKTPRDLMNVSFRDEHGTMLSLEDFRGKYLLVNIWATWCGPCREEMPALDKLALLLVDENFEVLAISVDVSGQSVVEGFYRRHGLKNLQVYIDPSEKVLRDLGVFGIPTTVLIDPSGRELGRLIGPAQWDNPDSVESLLQTMKSPGPRTE